MAAVSNSLNIQANMADLGDEVTSGKEISRTIEKINYVC